jgi:ABC-2 type transport system permease protein
MEIMRMVYLKGSSICDIGFQLSVLSSFALLLYAWAIRSYRKQQ